MQGCQGIAVEKYTDAIKHWPTEGQHILAQYTDTAVLVWQAYNPAITSHAAAHAEFLRAPGFSPHRTTWIKPNFLWMMFRSGWGCKHSQEGTLGIWLKRAAFDRILGSAVSSVYIPSVYESQEAYEKLLQQSKSAVDGGVRLQWDPDHQPNGAKHPARRAIQLGLRNYQSFVDGSDILEIVDMSEFVAQNRHHSTGDGWGELVVPVERVYRPASEETARRLGLSAYTC